MSILLPVNPPFSGWLVDGLKTVEWRKNPLPVGKAYIYDTKKNGGCGKVIGELYILRSTKEQMDQVLGKAYDHFSKVIEVANFLKEGKISKEDLAKYGNGKAVYACECVEAVRYSNLIPLSEFKRANRTEKNSPCAHAKWLFEPCETCKECNLKRPPQSWCYVEDLKGDAK